ncbi:MAG: succinic semialdehyde dehydrogenase [Acidobacteriota bacterium]
MSPNLLVRICARITVGSPHELGMVHAPFNNEPIRSVPLGREADIIEAVRRARGAQVEWARWSFDQRARIFLAYHDLLLDRQDEILDLMILETGKARKHAFEEVVDTAIVSRYYALHAEDHLRPRKRMGALPGLTKTWEYRHPLGVVGFIAPWNYPLTLSMTDAIAALMAGNGVVLKPDMQTPFTALWGVDLLYTAGLPADLFQVVTGRGKVLGEPLIRHADFISFTGGTETGCAIARMAGERLIGCSLELGGKNPMIVLDDADVDAAAEGAVRGCFANAGQLCIAIERLYVQAAAYGRFVERLVARTKAMRQRASFDYDIDVGSLVSQDQLDKVVRHVQDALGKGAWILAGGRARPDLGPFFHEPTILEGVTPEMDVSSEETFGPVVSVYRFDTIDEAVRMANDTTYGLNAGIWTRDAAKAKRLATHLRAGTVNVNEAYAAAWASVDAPMGGMKDSGLGRRHGAAGILKYTEPQTVALQRLHPIAPPPGVSDEKFSRLVSMALRLWRRIPGIR